MQNPSAWKSPDECTQGVPEVHVRFAPEAGPFFVTINVSSGAGGARREASVRQYLREAGVEAHVIGIAHPSDVQTTLQDVVELAKVAGGIVVVAGGDGTINSALPYLLDADVPLGVLPSGTFNYVAREFGIPLDLQEAVHTLATGRVTEVPVGQVNGQPFLVNASLGLYPRLLEDREHFERKHGRHRALALAASVSSLITRRAHTFSLEMQRARQDAGALGAPHQLEIATLFIGNNALQLERVGIDPEASSDALTAVALRPPSPLRLLELGLRATFGSLGDAKDVLTFSFEKLIAQERGASRHGIKVALDGEVTRMEGPLTFERAPKKLRLIVPADRAWSGPAPSTH